MIELREVASRADREAFIRLPGRIMADDPNWVEPLHFERRRFLTPRHNPFFAHADAAFWLAVSDGVPLGRISAQLDRLMPEDDGRRVGMFGMPAFPADPAVAAALFGAAEVWLRRRGAQLCRGPFSLSVNHECGLLVEGFDSPPSLLMPHDPPWAGPIVEGLGYAKARDLLAYRVRTEIRLPDGPRRLVAAGVRGVRVRSLDPRRFAEEIRTIAEIFNDAWAGNWGFVPMTEAEVEAMAAELRPIIDPDFIKIAELDGQAVGFIVLLPNVNEAIADLGGQLFPLGWAKLLWRLKTSRIRSARVPLMGVRRTLGRKTAGKLLPFLLIYALEDRCFERGIEKLELSWLLEDNHGMRRIVEAIGARVAKTNRIYEKALV